MHQEHPSKLDVAKQFYATLVARDWSAMREIIDDRASWVLPGDNYISGPADGGDAVVARGRLIAGYGLKFELLHFLESRTDVALMLHNTAQSEHANLDEYLATVLRVKDGKIIFIETFLSDVAGMNAFFSVPPPLRV